MDLCKSSGIVFITILFQIKLSDYAGKYVVLFFYPLDFTFVCPTEIIAFNDRLDWLKGKILKIHKDESVHSTTSHDSWKILSKYDNFPT